MYSNVLYFKILYRSIDRGLARGIGNTRDCSRFLCRHYFFFISLYLTPSFSLFYRIHIIPTSPRHVYLYIVYIISNGKCTLKLTESRTVHSQHQKQTIARVHQYVTPCRLLLNSRYRSHTFRDFLPLKESETQTICTNFV